MSFLRFGLRKRQDPALSTEWVCCHLPDEALLTTKLIGAMKVVVCEKKINQEQNVSGVATISVVVPDHTP